MIIIGSLEQINQDVEHGANFILIIATSPTAKARDQGLFEKNTVFGLKNCVKD